MSRLLGGARTYTDTQLAETLAMLVAHAIKRRASDIHIEPQDRLILIRYRIDGRLYGIHKLPRTALPGLLAQLKKLAGLKMGDTASPQEGSYETLVNQQTVRIHVATLPVLNGEKAVLHLQTERGKPEDLARLGFWGEGLAALQHVLASPYGLVLVAGPRHSGVSSTLFSMLAALNTPLVNITTIETRPAHRLPGVNQTFVNVDNGLHMHHALQAALKQDPNIMMIGDLPDAATAELAVRTATAGHLLLAGLHADSAAAGILRLRSTTVEPFLLATALRAAVAQRLVRRLCTACRKRQQLSQEELRRVAALFGIQDSGAWRRLHRLESAALAAGLGAAHPLSSTPYGITTLWQAHEAGCSACDHTGYNGQVAITEVLTSSSLLQRALLAPDIPSAARLQSSLLTNGFVPLALDGLVKSLRGMTTITEVLRVARS